MFQVHSNLFSLSKLIHHRVKLAGGRDPGEGGFFKGFVGNWIGHLEHACGVRQVSYFISVRVVSKRCMLSESDTKINTDINVPDYLFIVVTIRLVSKMVTKRHFGVIFMGKSRVPRCVAVVNSPFEVQLWLGKR